MHILDYINKQILTDNYGNIRNNNKYSNKYSNNNSSNRVDRNNANEMM